MNIVDIGIILIILIGALVGFKRGFTNELVTFVGFFIIIVLAFLFKNSISLFLYEHLPFFKFGGIFKGVTALNIVLYELIAFLIVLCILTFIFQIIKSVTKIFERILTMTIVLGIPSKMLGAVIGLIENYVWVFILLYITTIPVFNFDIFNESNLRNKILNNTPILSGFTENTIEVINEFSELKNKYEMATNASEFNRETLDLFLKYDVITVNSVQRLIDIGKLKVDRVDEILAKYREA